MAPPPSLPFLIKLFMILLLASTPTASTTVCHDTCGSIQIKYPFGTGPGCGSPLFNPYITCISNGTLDQLILKTHTSSYPITSISYTTSTLILTPPCMSTCTTMQTSPNFGLDLTSPFQISSSTFILLSCQRKSSTICDTSFDYLCASIYSCPEVVSLGLPLFPPTNTCCVYTPGNLDGEGELNVKGYDCGGYTSVVSLGDNPTDPTHWVYGVALKYTHGAFDNFVTTKCTSCESSGGICGFAPPGNGFVCVCKGGYNTSLDCSSYNQNQDYLWDSVPHPLKSSFGNVWSPILAGIILSLV
ncbi:wall-associated receptor kinase 20-like protein [Trifolium pratense]|uniref:Wall-associated receptor kinase 20-like protein n=3 Tax=Trifolium pratense TaxID=57577 RepID=A0A2K3NRP8_TRIPR|nr:wall-associated receptor kinase-like 20 [Trifolium pratense]PNY05697.1 wall-associated receptor kinase 20-like protein [Trifolium pratense]PNY11274.1 wall-associated receptor kinase 20-like protein [Trifolium pratense]CAJ2677085.1 unnamed protein product [Trifolium pratense]